jgi:SAM-dependent methyltransferase
MVFWHQDVYSEAMGEEAKRRLGLLGTALARVADRLERNIARESAAVVVIADTFVSVHERWRTPADAVSVIPNWGLLEEIKPGDRDNPFARKHGLVGSPVMLYSGTLGIKHNPDNLVELLRGVRKRLPDAQLVIVSEGGAADELKAREEPGLLVLPYQPFEDLPDVLASGDILVTILEPAAGRYSVPSKTLSYLCAGRPVLALLPRSNPMFALVEQAGGIARDPAHASAVTLADDAAALLADAGARAKRGQRARHYAEHHFDVSSISDRFGEILANALSEPAKNVPSEADSRPGSRESFRCNCCEGSNWQPMFEESGIWLGKCVSCGLLSIDKMPNGKARMTEMESGHYAGTKRVVRAGRQKKSEDALEAQFQRYVEVATAHAPTGRWLDVGCGAGTLLQLAEEAGFAVEGIELTSDRLAATRRAGFTVRDRPVEEVGYPDSTFDVISLINVFSHLTNPTDTFEELRRILTPRGVLVIATGEMSANVKKSDLYRWNLGDHLYFLGEGTMKILASKLGLTITREERVWMPNLMFSRPWLQAKGNSVVRNVVKATILHTPGAFALLRKVMLRKHRGNGAYAATFVLMKT